MFLVLKSVFEIYFPQEKKNTLLMTTQVLCSTMSGLLWPGLKTYHFLKKHWWGLVQPCKHCSAAPRTHKAQLCDKQAAAVRSSLLGCTLGSYPTSSFGLSGPLERLSVLLWAHCLPASLPVADGALWFSNQAVFIVVAVFSSTLSNLHATVQ